jgi:hypothetical protein
MGISNLTLFLPGLHPGPPPRAPPRASPSVSGCSIASTELKIGSRGFWRMPITMAGVPSTSRPPGAGCRARRGAGGEKKIFIAFLDLS